VNGRELSSFNSILVAVDGSPNSMRAAEIAVDLAEKNEASLYVLSVISAPVFASTGIQGTAGSSPSAEEFFDKAKKDAEGFVAGIVSKAEAGGLKVRGEIVENVPSVVEAITDYAEEWKIGLIVIGTRGLSGFKKLLLGSVSSELVSHAPCSVLVVR
jgi:nucleotide-binding universal stress UspA family protein